MNYKQTLDYLYSALPMFHRIGAAAYKADLNNTIKICKLLNNPQHNFKSIHIAGTNGKGSVSHFIASVLQERGLNVGLYTSPHFKDFRERIKINGKDISKKYVSTFVSKYKNDFEKINPSFFEMTVGMAFNYFSDKKVDIAVIETGLGGRLDSTNIITPILSVITNISFDHMNLLGETLEKIAFEKAGIIKSNVPVVIGESHKQTKQIFKDQAKRTNSSIFFADKNYCVLDVDIENKEKKDLFLNIERKKDSTIRKLKSPLTGLYQRKNLLTVLQSIDLLNEQGMNIKETHIAKGISRVIENTGIMGRWQILSKNPLVVCDMAHNEDGVRQVVAQIATCKYKQLHFVIGMVNDKDIDSVLKLLPPQAIYYFCKANMPRGLDASALQAKATVFSLSGKTYHSVKKAFNAAKEHAGKNDLVFVGGSTFVVAEIL